jgi:hypothetical protein
MLQYRSARMVKKKFKSQLASCHHSPLQLQVQKVDKSLTILPLWFEKEQLSCLFQR